MHFIIQRTIKRMDSPDARDMDSLFGLAQSSAKAN